MIHIFIENHSEELSTVYFVQMGCFYECDKNKTDILIDNVMSMYSERLEALGIPTEETEYLPISTYNRLYASDYCSVEVRKYKNVSVEIKKNCI